MSMRAIAFPNEGLQMTLPQLLKWVSPLVVTALFACEDGNSQPALSLLVDTGEDDATTDVVDDTSEDSAADAAEDVETDADGGIDEDLRFYYEDQDSDGYGTNSRRRLRQATGVYRATRSGDCNDRNRLVNPAQAEICGNGVDDNCRDGIDENLRLYYEDRDSDGYGLDSSTMSACTATGAFTATRGGDCDDGNRLVNPDATEICDGIDNDCVDGTDEGLTNACGGCTPFVELLGATCDGASGATWVCAADAESLVCHGGGGGCIAEEVRPQDLDLTCGGGAVPVSWLTVQACSLSTHGAPCDGSGCYAIPVVEDALLLIDGELRLDLSAAPVGCGVTRADVLEYWVCAGEFEQITVSLYDAADDLLAETSSPPASSTSLERNVIVESVSEATSAVIRSPYGCIRSLTVE